MAMPIGAAGSIMGAPQYLVVPPVLEGAAQALLGGAEAVQQAAAQSLLFDNVVLSNFPRWTTNFTTATEQYYNLPDVAGYTIRTDAAPPVYYQYMDSNGNFVWSDTKTKKIPPKSFNDLLKERVA